MAAPTALSASPSLGPRVATQPPRQQLVGAALPAGPHPPFAQHRAPAAHVSRHQACSEQVFLHTACEICCCRSIHAQVQCPGLPLSPKAHVGWAHPRTIPAYMALDAQMLVTLSPIFPTTSVCLPGYGAPSCAECAIGAWSAGGNASTPSPDCEACPSGKTTLAARSNSSASCSGDFRIAWFACRLCSWQKSVGSKCVCGACTLFVGCVEFTKARR